MRKLLAIVLSVLLLCSIVPMSMMTSTAAAVKVNALNITNENLSKNFVVRTNNSKNDSLTNYVTEGVSVLEDGTLCIETAENTKIGKIDFRFLRNALNKELLTLAGGKVTAVVATENPKGPTLLYSRFPFSKTTNTSY